MKQLVKRGGASAYAHDAADKSPDAALMEDLINLPTVTSTAVADALRRRAEAADGGVYTRCGPLLVALNPFEQQINLYATDVLEAYQRRAKFVEQNVASAAEADDSTPRTSAAAPHIYEIAAAAYQGLLSRGTSQSVVINGESGAGKIESCKLILRCLTHAARDAAASTVARSEGLARRLHATNPILESLGNAKTLRNDNSSRFGKFVRLHFSAAGALTGASVQRYLLEKSRVTSQDAGERSFHALYQLCAGASFALRETLLLECADDAAASRLGEHSEDPRLNPTQGA